MEFTKREKQILNDLIIQQLHFLESEEVSLLGEEWVESDIIDLNNIQIKLT